MEKREMSVGSLRYLVYKNAPLEYRELCKKYCNNYIEDLTTSSSHHDIATLMHFEFGEIFRCGSIKNNSWHHFYNHVWNHSDQGITLKKKISSIIANKYEKCKYKLIGEEKEKMSQKIRDLEKKINWFNARLNSSIEGLQFCQASKKK